MIPLFILSELIMPLVHTPMNIDTLYAHRSEIHALQELSMHPLYKSPGGRVIFVK